MKKLLAPPRWLTAFGTRFMPFADAASPELPLPRLMRLALFQAVIGMVTALLVGTLNRVMIVELQVPAWWVALAVAVRAGAKVTRAGSWRVHAARPALIRPMASMRSSMR